MIRYGTALLCISLFLAACSGTANSPTAISMASPTAIIDSLEGFEAALKQAANSFEKQANVESDPGLQGNSYLINGQQVIALESVEMDAEQVSAGIAEFAQGLSATTRYWRSGDLAVFYAGEDGGISLLISGILGDPQTLQPPAQDEPYPPAVLVSIRHVSEETGVNPSDVEVETFVSVTWPDTCLGLAQTGEACGDALVDGWQVRLRAGDQIWQVHTDEFGRQLRSQQQ